MSTRSESASINDVSLQSQWIDGASLMRYADVIASNNPWVDSHELYGCMDVVDKTFRAHASFLGETFRLHSSSQEEAVTVFQFTDAGFGDIAVLHHEMLGFLRVNYASRFDLPSQRILQQIRERNLVQTTKRVIFDRLVCDPHGAQGADGHPFIVARWNMHSGHPLHQTIGIGYHHDGRFRYAFQATITEKDEARQPIWSEEPPVASEDQEDEYVHLMLHASEVSLSEGKYPFSAVVSPAGDRSPLIIARNANRAQGEGMNGHAEHIALLDMNHKGYKVIWERAEQYHPVLYSLFAPCHGCAQMAREQGVDEVKYILEQPKGWSGSDILLDDRLTDDCGPPPRISQMRKYIPQALEIVRKANQEVFPGEFRRILAINQEIANERESA